MEERFMKNCNEVEQSYETNIVTTIKEENDKPIQQIETNEEVEKLFRMTKRGNFLDIESNNQEEESSSVKR